jgi:hypothetical protein
MNTNIKNFINHVVIDILDHHGSIELIHNKRVYFMDGKNKIIVNGYFTLPIKIAIATNKPTKLWLQTLVHEYAHFNQYIENESSYMECANVEGMDRYESWLACKEELDENFQKIFE